MLKTRNLEPKNWNLFDIVGAYSIVTLLTLKVGLVPMETTSMLTGLHFSIVDATDIQNCCTFHHAHIFTYFYVNISFIISNKTNINCPLGYNLNSNFLLVCLLVERFLNCEFGARINLKSGLRFLFSTKKKSKKV